LSRLYSRPLPFRQAQTKYVAYSEDSMTEGRLARNAFG
jgi:hypothetical protein